MSKRNPGQQERHTSYVDRLYGSDNSRPVESRLELTPGQRQAYTNRRSTKTMNRMLKQSLVRQHELAQKTTYEKKQKPMPRWSQSARNTPH